MAFIFETPLSQAQILYLLLFCKKSHYTIIEKSEDLPKDALLTILKMPNGIDAQYYIGTRFVWDVDGEKSVPVWKPELHNIFSQDFQEVVVYLLCIQKYIRKNIDKNIFYAIIEKMCDMETITDILDFSQKNILKYYIYPTIRSNVSNPTLLSGIPSGKCKCDKTGKYIFWDGNHWDLKKDEWLEYLKTNFLIPWGIDCDGRTVINVE